MFHRNLAAAPFVMATATLLMAFSPNSAITASSLAREVAHVAGVQRDVSLNQAARIHARDILKDRNKARWERVKAALRQEGIADAQFWPVAVIGQKSSALVERLRKAVADQGGVRGATHVGVAVATHDASTALVALFVRRLVRLSPLPSSAARAGLLVRGQTDVGQRLEALWMGPCHDTLCAGGVRSLRPQPGHSGWSLRLPPMKGEGAWTLELMVETERGPEPAILWQFGQDRPGGTPSGSPERWVALFRARHELAPLSRNRALDRAAAQHAREVCAQRFAAHILPDGLEPQHRAQDAGYDGRVTENVAVAPTAAAAHRDLLRSPSHRRNLMDATAVHYGLAIETAAAKAGTRPIRCWVELFGQPSQNYRWR